MRLHASFVSGRQCSTLSSSVTAVQSASSTCYNQDTASCVILQDAERRRGGAQLNELHSYKEIDCD